MSCGVEPVDRPGDLDVHDVGLPGHADERLRLEVEERLDLRRVGEVDPAPPHQVPLALEDHLAALDFRAARTAWDGRRCRAAPGRRSPRCGRRCSRRAATTAPGSCTSKRSGRLGGRGGGAGGGRATAADQADQPGAEVDALVVERVLHRHRAAQHRRRHRPDQVELRVDRRPEALGVAELHVLAGGRQRRAGRGVKPLISTRPPKRTLPPASWAVTSSSRIPSPAERHAAVDRLHRLRQRQVADAPVGDLRVAGEHGLVERPVDRALQHGAARAAHVAEEALQDGEVRVARHASRRCGPPSRPSSAPDTSSRVSLPRQLQPLRASTRRCSRTPAASARRSRSGSRTG